MFHTDPTRCTYAPYRCPSFDHVTGVAISVAPGVVAATKAAWYAYLRIDNPIKSFIRDKINNDIARVQVASSPGSIWVGPGDEASKMAMICDCHSFRCCGYDITLVRIGRITRTCAHVAYP